MAGLDEWYLSLPIVTRTYLTVAFLTTLACTMEIVTPYQLYLNFNLVFRNHQYWRLLTTFCFFDKFGLHFLFHMHFLYIYCRRLEEHFYRGKTADFVLMLLFGSFVMLLAAPFLSVPFLGHSLVFMVLYVWSRRSPGLQLNFLGLFPFSAPYLAWVLLGFSLMLGGSPVFDLLGIFVGHFYYFLDRVLPLVYGVRVLKAPYILKWAVGEAEEDPNANNANNANNNNADNDNNNNNGNARGDNMGFRFENVDQPVGGN